jgi:3-isopropylmalate dehydrogenase
MKLKKKIVVLPGDGIGPEVSRAAVNVLQECAREFGHQFDVTELPIGGAAIDKTRGPLPNETLDACRKADAVFLGAVGGAKWDSLPVGKRPETGLLELRKGLGLFVNLRPVRLIEPLRGISPLRPERLGDLDIEIVRELAGGMYFGERGNVTEGGAERAFDTESYSTPEIERIATFAFQRAEVRSRRLCSVDKANVLTSSQLWRRTVTAIGGVYPAVKLEHMYVDNAAMQLTLRPTQFDVILSTNMFGDILSDAAAALVGSIGSVLSATMMLRDTFGLGLEADWVEQSVNRVLAARFRTSDISEPGTKTVGTKGFLELLHVEMQRTFEHAEKYGWGV